jgi:site-specific DNA-methyltransferase (adenine-specific)
MMEQYINKIIHADCMDILKQLPDKCIDAIICDLPYGTTACSWDVVIPFEDLWKQYKRIRKDNTPIVLFGSQPFTTMLIASNIKEFKYEWIWQKAVGSNFANLKYQPMKEHENICVFSKNTCIYNPQMQNRSGCGAERVKYVNNGSIVGKAIGAMKFNGAKPNQYNSEERYPSTVQYFNNRDKDRGMHPTQKPVALLEYLIKTYSNEGDLILDNCSGSGSLAIACHNLNRRFICIEKDYDYWKASVERLEREQAQLKLFDKI